MANYSKLIIQVDDWSIINVGDYIQPKLHNTAGDYFVNCLMTAATTGGVPGKFRPNTSNYLTCVSLYTGFNLSYGEIGVLDPLPVAISTPVEGIGGSWYFEVELTEYGWDYWDISESTPGVSMTKVDEVLPIVPEITGVTASTAISPLDRNTKVGYTATFNGDYPYIITSPVNQTGEGTSASFEFFRFPEPQSDLSVTFGSSLVELFSKVTDSPGGIPDVTLATVGNIDTLTVNTGYTLESDLFTATSYIIGYEYTTTELSDKVYIRFRLKFSADYIGSTANIRYIISPESGGGAAIPKYGQFPITSTDWVEYVDTYTFTDPAYPKLSNLAIIAIGDEVIGAGSTIEVDRSEVIGYNDGADTDTVTLPRVDIWDIDSVTHVVSQGAATATINASKTKVGDISTTIQYSLNGVDYQNSNVFTELENGSYTAYILDTYGLIEELAFEIGDVIPPEEERPDSFLDISPVNSIQFSDEANEGTFFSRYDKQKFTNIEFQSFYQLFTQNDAIPTQIRTNYETITIDVINCVTGEIVQNPPAQLKIKNQNLRDKRDCVLGASVQAGFTNIYFQGGNVYDPDTDAVLGKNILNGDLENWMKEGVKVTISGQSPGSTLNGSYDIVDRLYNSNIPAEVMVISATFAELEAYQVAILESEYDDEIWDVYEFTTDFSQLPKGYYYIRVSVTDTNSQYEDMSFISEPILVGDNSKALQIDYKSDSRVIYDLYSSTGISHRLRIPSQLYEYAPIQEIDSFNDDFNNEIIKKRTTKASLTLKTGFIPPYLARKLNLAFLHSLQGDTFTIDGIKYTPLGESEVEAKSSERNPFVTLTQQMQATEGAVSVDSSGVISSDSANALGAGTNKVIGV